MTFRTTVTAGTEIPVTLITYFSAIRANVHTIRTLIAILTLRGRLTVCTAAKTFRTGRFSVAVTAFIA